MSPLLTTFRDPAGHLEVRPGGAYRIVHPPHDVETLEFLESPLACALVEQGRLVASEVLSIDPHLELRHPRIAFPAYPWEWSPSMWISAAELTLELCAELLEEGWLLKDATPLNVLFEGARPVFVDVLSITRADLREPIWYGYGQFTRTFLLPLLAYSRLGWPLQASMVRRDGYEPEELGDALSLADRWRQPALSAVTLPLLFSRRKTTGKLVHTPRTVDPDAGRYIIGKTIDRLLNHVRTLRPASKESAWSNYADTLAHYTEEDVVAKQDFVRGVLASSRPRHVLDVGCNAGVYSRIAAEAGAQVVAVDTDLETVDRLYRSLESTPLRDSILPLCVDLSRPTPALGWENRESASFLQRCDGHFDLVLMLAVIHHLLLGSQIPLSHIAALCGTLTTKDLILEWVPPADEKYQEVLRGRGAIYGHIHEAAFRAAFAEHFHIVDEMTLGNKRILFHMRRRSF